MQPIINPWFIYLLGVIDSAIEFFAIIAVSAGFAFIGFLIGYLICKHSDDFDEEYAPIWKKLWKRTLPIFVIFALLGIFLPNRNTLIGMFVAKNITYDNVEKALKAGKDFKEELKKDVFELIKAIQDKKTEENN